MVSGDQASASLAKRPWTFQVGIVVALAGTYAALARGSLLFASVNSSVSPIWLPTGLAIAALLIFGLRTWPGVALGAFLANWANGTAPPVAAALGAGNALEAVVAVWLVMRFAGGLRAFGRAVDVVRFAVLAGVGAAVGATVGVASLSLAGLSPWNAFGEVWVTWWLGDAVGAIGLTPLIILWTQEHRVAWARGHVAEALLVAATALTLGVLLFSGRAANTAVPAILLGFPVAWAAFRFGPREAVTVTMLLSAVAVWGTVRGYGPFVATSENGSLLLLSSFLGVLNVTGLAIAALAGERDRYETGLRRARDEADLHVRVRTAQLEEVLGRYRILADGSLLGIFHTDATGRLDYANQRWLEIAGCADTKSATVVAAVHPDDRKGLQEAWRACLATGTGFVHEFRFQHADGRACLVSTLAAPLRAADGNVVGYSGYVEDVTERRASETALRESEERMRFLVDGLKDHALYMLDPEGHVITWNTGAQRLKGYTAAEVVGSHFERFCTPEDVAAGMPAMVIRAAADTGRFEGELQVVRKDGSRFWANVGLTALRDPDGKLRGFAKLTRDITERKRAEAQADEMARLGEVNRFKEGFLRNAAHELGTPLTPLKIQMSLLKHLVHAAPGSTEEKTVAILDRNIERLHALVRDMLEAARVQAGRLPLRLQPMDMAHAIHDVTDTFQAAALQAGVHLDVQGPQHVPIVADAERVSQVLYNLVSNAMKFTPKGGAIIVETRVGAELCVTVRDTGTGLTADQAARLFQPFVQVHDVTVRDPGGSGLGLYISKGIVEAHGGTLAVHSAGPGKGCSFTFTLPMQAVATRAEPVRAAPIRPAP